MRGPELAPQTGLHPGAIEIAIESALWDRAGEAAAVVQRAIAAAAEATAAGGEVSVLLTDDAAIRRLNWEWRHRDAPTNVLSFPAPGGKNGEPRLLGDIVIAFETTWNEAVVEGKAFPHHLAHLAVHGFLHLLGYDHETDDEAETMERLERAIMTRLDLPDPYGREAEADDKRHA
jgi:probable rRNA maturation factor